MKEILPGLFLPCHGNNLYRRKEHRNWEKNKIFQIS
jgi:hypothetical protein